MQEVTYWGLVIIRIGLRGACGCSYTLLKEPRRVPINISSCRCMDMAFNFWLRRADQNSSPFLGGVAEGSPSLVETLGLCRVYRV